MIYENIPEELKEKEIFESWRLEDTKERRNGKCHIA